MEKSKKKTIKNLEIDKKNTGSSEAQIGFLTSKIGVTCIYLDKKYEKSISSIMSI